jgi:hypothetical protein
MPRKGQCLCGAISFEITKDVTETGACHCGMCRRWSGGIFLGVEVPAADMRVTGEVSRYASSAWAERCFCGTCGTSLWYRVTAPGPHQGNFHVGFGTLDDPEGVVLSGEIFIDKKPAGYALEGEHHKMTEAEVMAMFSPG